MALAHPADSPARTSSLREALRHWRTARDLSPVMAPTHARLGRYRDLFDRADPAVVYFERARYLLPTDADMAFFSGEARWKTGDIQGACSDWKDSLRYSDRHLIAILDHAKSKLAPGAILSDILPDHPATILRANEILFPKPDQYDAGRREYLSRAQQLIAALPQKTAADWELEARLHIQLGRTDEAALAYRRALGLSPRQTAWRLDYAQLLRRSGSLKEARDELETVLAQDPNNHAARDLRDVLLRELKLAKKE
jgi:tetratricopeptide (TPR) repeat protein